MSCGCQDIKITGVVQTPIVSDSVTFVKVPGDLAGTLDSSKVYVIDSTIDFTNTGILPLDIPVGGLNLRGHDFNVSKMVTSEVNVTMFQTTTGGDFVAIDLAFEVTGANSQVFDIKSATGVEATEMTRVNFNSCTSLGEIDNYRQGLESGNGRFGGTPSLTLSGTWSGGYFIETTIVRVLNDGAYYLFQAGTGLTFGSRFRSDMNVDLPASAGYVDFSSANFINDNTLQFNSGIVTRNGVSNPEDTNIVPNITNADIKSFWKNNVGMMNTHVGGQINMDSGTAVTTITLVGATVDLVGTWGATFLEHFDNPSGNQLRHLAASPQEFKVSASVTVTGTAGNQLELYIVKNDGVDSTVVSQTKEVLNLPGGGSDIATFIISGYTTLGDGNYLRMQIANNTSTANVTCTVNSFMTIEER